MFIVPVFITCPFWFISCTCPFVTSFPVISVTVTSIVEFVVSFEYAFTVVLVSVVFTVIITPACDCVYIVPSVYLAVYCWRPVGSDVSVIFTLPLFIVPVFITCPFWFISCTCPFVTSFPVISVTVTSIVEFVVSFEYAFTVVLVSVVFTVIITPACDCVYIVPSVYLAVYCWRPVGSDVSVIFTLPLFIVPVFITCPFWFISCTCPFVTSFPVISVTVTSIVEFVVNLL